MRDVSFDVERGEIFGVIGANGAGKSTLLAILARITEPTAGLAEIRGRVSSLLEVGTGSHPELSGRDNVFLNGTFLGMSRAETRRKFDEIVEFSELGDLIDMPVKRYSTGMYMPAAFSVEQLTSIRRSSFLTRCSASATRRSRRSRSRASKTSRVPAERCCS